MAEQEGSERPGTEERTQGGEEEKKASPVGPAGVVILAIYLVLISVLLIYSIIQFYNINIFGTQIDCEFLGMEHSNHLFIGHIIR